MPSTTAESMLEVWNITGPSRSYNGVAYRVLEARPAMYAMQVLFTMKKHWPQDTYELREPSS